MHAKSQSEWGLGQLDPLRPFPTDHLSNTSILKRTTSNLSNKTNFNNNICPIRFPSFHERFENYYRARARIFSKNNSQYTKKFQRLQTFRTNCKLKKKSLKEVSEVEEIKTSDNRPYGTVFIEGKELKGLLDSGASLSVLGRNSLQFLKSIGKTFVSLNSNVSTSDGTKQPVVGVVYLLAKYNFQEHVHKFFVVPTLSQEVYLGFDFWRVFNIAPELHHLQVS